jgi:hypothetical protein
MRVAVCFTGMIRTGVESSNNLKQWLGSVYKDIDFFMHTWDYSESKAWHDNCSFLKNNTSTQNLYRESAYPLLEKLVPMYDHKFISVEVEDYDKFAVSHFFKKFICFSPLWYSWYRGMQLIDQHEIINNFRYDVIIKIRPDIIFPKGRSLQTEIEKYAKDMSCLYTLGYNPVRIDDVMFLGSSTVMKKASRFVVDTSKTVWETNMLGEWLIRRNIRAVNTVFTDYCIYRKEHIELGVDPMKFNKCVNVDRDYYAPYNVDRLAEDDE